MAFKKIRQSNISAENPEALFRDLRNRKVEGLLSHQADILREYYKLREYDKQGVVKNSDVAIQLPTGSGKTLVALLIGEWNRRHFNHRVVYLCPTRQLVNQVVEQASSKYGIKANAFLGGRTDYPPTIKAEYTNAETLAVTTYSSLFNINPFFDNADIIIFDDAHASENYIAQHWSLVIERNKTKHQALFKAMVAAIRELIPNEHYTRIFGDYQDFKDTQWVEKIPTPYFYKRLPEIRAILDEHIQGDNDLKYSWSVIRDKLFACHIYSSYSNFLIRPVIPPTLTHQAFSNAKQRIYMSATLGEGGELERLTGVEKIVRLSIPEGWDKQGIGRRLFMFPERCLDDKATLKLAIELIKEAPRALVLVPDDRSESEIDKIIKESKIDYQIFKTEQIEKSKQSFVSHPKAIAIVANRYDGIDLVGDECRLLIVKGLQRSTNLQEKFLVTRMPASILFNERILTRIVQAIGRCTRSPNDYAAVVIIGEELNKFLLDPSKRQFLHPEIQAEILFGIEQSKDVKAKDFIDNIKIFLDHQEEWHEAEEDIISQRDSLEQFTLPGIDKLRSAV